MSSRRGFLACAGSLALFPRAVRAEAVSRLSITGTREQGSLVIGKTEPKAIVTSDGTPIGVSPEGFFAAGLAYDRVGPLHLSAKFADGSLETSDITPVKRQYEIQRINGLPEKYVSPPKEIEARIQREHARLSQMRTHDTDKPWFAEPFDWPAAGIVSGLFGSQRILNGTASAPHFGVDIAAAEGTPVHAPAGAIVLLAEEFYLEGNFTLLDHGHGVFTFYMHQSKQMVKPGDTVARGQLIGLVGKTGRATGPHLHWSMNWFQVKLDPSRSTRESSPPKA